MGEKDMTQTLEELKEEATNTLDGSTGGCACFSNDERDLCSYHRMNDRLIKLLTRAFQLGREAGAKKMMEAVEEADVLPMAMHDQSDVWNVGYFKGFENARETAVEAAREAYKVLGEV